MDSPPVDADARISAFIEASSECDAQAMDERDQLRKELEHADAMARLAKLQADHETLKAAHEKQVKLNKNRKTRLTTQLERANRMLMALVVAVILAAFSSMPAARELAWTIVKALVTPK